MIRAGHPTPAPLRPVPSWDGRHTLYRCDECGCSVKSTHRPGGIDCRELARERVAKRFVGSE